MVTTFTREEKIMKTVERIEQSGLSPETYIRRYGAPFSIAQYYRYRAQLSNKGEEGLRDKRGDGNNRKIGRDEITFLRGFLKDREEVSPSRVRQAVEEEFGISVHLSTMSRVLKKLGIETKQQTDEVIKKVQVSCVLSFPLFLY